MSVLGLGGGLLVSYLLRKFEQVRTISLMISTHYWLIVLSQWWRELSWTRMLWRSPLTGSHFHSPMPESTSKSWTHATTWRNWLHRVCWFRNHQVLYWFMYNAWLFAYRWYCDLEVQAEKLDILFVDLAGSMHEDGLSCPPAVFITTEVLATMKAALKPDGQLFQVYLSVILSSVSCLFLFIIG